MLVHNTQNTNHVDDLLDQRVAQFRVAGLSSAKPNAHLYLVPFTQESMDMFHLKIDVVSVGLRPKLDLFKESDHLFFLRDLLLLLQVVLKLSVVENLTNWGIGIGRNFRKIEALRLCELDGSFEIHDAKLVAVGANDSDLSGPNSVIDTDVIVGRLSGVNG